MQTITVPGKNNKHRVLLYALSTCVWCKRVKKFFQEYEIQYDFFNVDLHGESEREEVTTDILRRGGRLSYPTIIIDDKTLITGFNENELREVLEI